MRVGVNYTPRQGWFHAWSDLDAAEVDRDLGAIAALGLDHVRIFPLWPQLQPHRGHVRERALTDVMTVVDRAAGHGLEVWVDALNGHLSSFDFLPAWVGTWHRRNLFTDPQVREAQVQLVTALAERLREHPAARGLGLGNEFSQFAAPRHPERHAVDSGGVRSWLDDLLGAASRAWPEGRHAHSFDDDLWFVDDHPFLPEHAVTRGAMTTVHSWVFGKDWSAYADPPLTAFTRYLLELAAAWSPDPARPLWLQEVGAPISHVPSAGAPQFLRRTLESCLDMPGLEAVTWWCSHDVDRRLLDFPELEHTLGLFDSTGEVKPIGRELAGLLPDLRAASGAPAGPRDTLELCAADDGSDRSSTLPGRPLFDAWLAAHRAGRTPSLTRVVASASAGTARRDRLA